MSKGNNTGFSVYWLRFRKPSRSMTKSLFPLLKNFKYINFSKFINFNDSGGASDRLDIEDPDLRVYLHSDRLKPGFLRLLSIPHTILFGPAIVMIEIGLWKRFRSLEGYPSSWDYSDRQRQRF